MRFFCPACGTAHSISDDKIPAGGSTVDCSKCGFAIKIKGSSRPKPAAAATEQQIKAAKAAPAAPAATEQAIPAAEQPQEAWASEDTDPGAAGQDDWADEGYADDLEPEPSAGSAYEPEPAEPADPAPAAAAPKAQPKPKAKPKAKAKKPAAAKMPKMPKDVKLPYPGCGRSGDRFRFRDLFFALQAPLDLRKTLASGAGIFVGTAMFVLIGYLAMLAKSQIVGIIGMILGLVVYFACLYLGLGVATRQTDREMLGGQRLPMSEGLGFVKAKLFNVVGFPFLFVIGIVAAGVVIAVFHLIARIPIAGPIVYGLTFAVVFCMAVLAVLIGVLMIFSTFSYIPAAGDHGLFGLAKHLWQVIKRSPGWYSLHLLIAVCVSGLVMWVLTQVLGYAFSYIYLVDGLAGGGEVPGVLASMPGLMGPVAGMLFDLPGHGGAQAGWQFTIAGWTVFIFLMMIFSLVQGFVLTYFSAAGVVNYHLLTQDEDDG